MEKITPERMKELFKLRSEGEITLNKAREECGLPPHPRRRCASYARRCT